jgi:hypothetical protein
MHEKKEKEKKLVLCLQNRRTCGSEVKSLVRIKLAPGKMVATMFLCLRLEFLDGDEGDKGQFGPGEQIIGVNAPGAQVAS